jgi:hypothetical protein
LSMVSNYLVLREIFSPSKEALIRASSIAPKPEGRSRSRAQAQLGRLGVGVVLHVLGGCA